MNTLHRYLLATSLCCLVLALSGCGSDDGSSDGSGQAGSTTGGGPITGTGGGPISGTGGAGPTTTSSPLSINELMPSNTSGAILDEGGATADWIELYNGSDTDISLGSYFISDSLEQPLQAPLAASLTVPAHGVLVLWADSDTEQGDNHLPFNLDRDGDAVVLSDPAGVLLDSIEFEYTESDVCYARFPDGTGSFQLCASATPGELNGSACGS
jgi:hypothetical protein